MKNMQYLNTGQCLLRLSLSGSFSGKKKESLSEILISVSLLSYL